MIARQNTILRTTSYAPDFFGVAEGISYTQKDVSKWQTNFISGKYKARDDVKTNSPGEYDFIKANAITFLSNPLADIYQAFPSYVGTAILGDGGSLYSLAEVADDKRNFLCAALVYATEKNLNYGLAVKQYLLAQIGQSTTNLGDTVRWASDVIGDLSPSYYFASWVHKNLIAYEYTRNLFTALEQQAMQEWFFKISIYFKDRNINVSMEKIWNNRYTETWTATGSYEFTARLTHYGGNTTLSRQRFYNNRRAIGVSLFGSIGLLLKRFGHTILPTNVGLTTTGEVNTKIDEMIRDANIYTKETLRFSVYADNISSEFERSILSSGTDANDSERGFTYVANTFNSLCRFASNQLRCINAGVSGLTNLFDYSTSAGYSAGGANTIGGTKTLLNVWLELAKLYKGERLIYGTDVLANNGNANYLINGRENLTPFREYLLTFAFVAEANELYWNNDTLRQLYLGNISGSLYPTLANTGSEGSHRPQGLAHGFDVVNLFKFL
jgi:hypothetical protein